MCDDPKKWNNETINRNMENHHTLQICSLQRSAELELLALFLCTELELTPTHTLSLTILNYFNLVHTVLFYYTKPIQPNSAFQTEFCFIPYEPIVCYDYNFFYCFSYKAIIIIIIFPLSATGLFLLMCWNVFFNFCAFVIFRDTVCLKNRMDRWNQGANL